MFSKYTTLLTILRWLVVLAISSPSLCVFAPLREMNVTNDNAYHAKTLSSQRQGQFADSSFPVAACHRQHTYLPSSYSYTDH